MESPLILLHPAGPAALVQALGKRCWLHTRHPSQGYEVADMGRDLRV
uniref:Uncharacterized protein n=1 Tax=Anguilla anguilla TaxID=7936 RepID=A0A0E9QLX7_ANGAN